MPQRPSAADLDERITRAGNLLALRGQKINLNPLELVHHIEGIQRILIAAGLVTQQEYDYQIKLAQAEFLERHVLASTPALLVPSSAPIRPS